MHSSFPSAESPNLKRRQFMSKNNHILHPGNGKICCQIFLKVLFSHTGTSLMVVLYIIMGGFLFKYLEEENEVSACLEKYNKYSMKLNENIQRIMAISTSNQNTDLFFGELQKMLSFFAGDVLRIDYEPGKNCSTIGQTGNLAQWNIYNSIFFCVTIITTIGKNLKEI